MDAIAVAGGVIVLTIGLLLGAQPAVDAIWPPEPESQYCAQPHTSAWGWGEGVWVACTEPHGYELVPRQNGRYYAVPRIPE